MATMMQRFTSGALVVLLAGAVAAQGVGAAIEKASRAHPRWGRNPCPRRPGGRPLRM